MPSTAAARTRRRNQDKSKPQQTSFEKSPWCEEYPDTLISRVAERTSLVGVQKHRLDSLLNEKGHCHAHHGYVQVEGKPQQPAMHPRSETSATLSAMNPTPRGGSSNTHVRARASDIVPQRAQVARPTAPAGLLRRTAPKRRPAETVMAR